MSLPVIILGASARGAAFSALRAGLEPHALDLFADCDLRAHARVTLLPPNRYPEGFLSALKSLPAAPWMYTGGLENHPGLVEELARHRPLWGNPAEVLRQVRSPGTVHQVLKNAGLASPAIWSGPAPPEPDGRWLLKPLSGAGGSGIQRWVGPDLPALPHRSFSFQEVIPGPAHAALYLGDGTQARLLGVTRQLVGETWLHARPFAYCGSIGPISLGEKAQTNFTRLGQTLVAAFGLKGVFGVDCILREEVPWPVEINPRYTASVEVLEHATGGPILALHRRVFDSESLLEESLPPPRWLIGKAILFARDSLEVPRDGPWHPWLPPRGEEPWPGPAFADIPTEGERIERGRPIVSILVREPSVADCLAHLKTVAAELDRRLFPP